MLNNVSKLVNLRNAKKLAQNDASQMDSSKCLSNLSKVIHQNVSGELQNSSTSKSPRVPQESVFGSSRSRTDETDVKMRARASEGKSSQTTSEVESMTSHSPHAPRESIFGSESSRAHKTDVKIRAGASEGQSSQTTCEVGRLSKQSPHASLALFCGSGRRKTDQTQAKTNMMTVEKPQSGILDLMCYQRLTVVLQSNRQTQIYFRTL